MKQYIILIRNKKVIPASKAYNNPKRATARGVAGSLSERLVVYAENENDAFQFANTLVGENIEKYI